MADTTLNPGTEVVPATTRLTDYAYNKTKYPVEGNKYGMLWLEIDPGYQPEVMALVAQLRALAVDSDMVHGAANSDGGKRTAVHLQVQQIPNVPLEA